MNIFILRDGEQHGPYSEVDARGHVAANTLKPDDLAWHEGLDEWKPLSDVLFDLHRLSADKVTAFAVEPQNAASQNAASPGVSRAFRRSILIAGGVLALIALSLAGWRFVSTREHGRTSQNASAPSPPSDALGKKFAGNKAAAEQGDAKAQYDLGVCYRDGSGVAKDSTEAARLWRKAAEQGHAGAQCELGYCYLLGQGVATDLTEAVKWYRKAAEQGDAHAQVMLGNHYKGDYEGEKNLMEAVKWYRKAAEQGDDVAQYFLGNYYSYESPKTDYAKP